MRKKLFRIPLFLLALACSSVTADAQMRQMRIYSPSRNELITKVKTMPDGSSVMGGYIYDVTGGSVTNTDMILVRVKPDGTIMWQKQFGTAGSTAADLINGISLASNGDILVVGTVGRSSTYQNNTAAIFRFNSSGALLWSNFVRRDVNVNAPGDIFNDVAELANGNIIAVGGDDFTPGSSKSMICMFNSAGTLLYNETFDRSGSDEFLSVVASGGNAVISGWFDGFNYKDSRILLYRPGGTSGTFIWDKSYDVTGAMNAAGRNFTCDGFTKVFIRGSRIVCNAFSAEAYGFVPNMHGFFECDLANGANPALRGLSNNGLTYSNNSAMYPVDDQRFFVTQTPANFGVDAALWTNPTYTNSVISEVRPFQASGQVVQSKEFNLDGNQSVFDIDMYSSDVYFAGCTTNPTGTGDNDIYFVVSNQSLTDSVRTCDLQPAGITISQPTLLTSSATETRSTFTNNSAYTMAYSDPGFRSELLCGTPVVPPPTGDGGCDLQCYWRVDGNSAINQQNVLGTLNNQDIRMVTNGTQRAVLERQFGNFGLNTPAPTARLHVLCNPQNQSLSDVRFENLNYGTGQVLVIDGAGYVHRSDRLQGKEAPSATLDSLTGVIAQLQRDVAYLMTAMKQTDGGSAMGAADISLYPNPAGNSVTLELKGDVPMDRCIVQITDISGKTLITQKAGTEGGRSIRINTTPLAPGSYFVKLTADNKTLAVRSLVIQK